MTITTLDGLVAGAKTKLPFYKISLAAKAANTFASLWKVGNLPLAGETPPTGAGAAPTMATLGSFNFSEVGGETSAYVARSLLKMATLGEVILYDRLVHTSGLVGNSTEEQAVNSAALTRATDGAGVEMFIESYAATGATASTCTISYTNQAGTAGRISSFAFQATAIIGQMQLCPLQAGDTGVKSVQSVTLSASTGTAGDFGITLAKRVVDLSVDATNNSKLYSPFDLGLPAITPSACLAFMVYATATNTGILSGSLDIIQG